MGEIATICLFSTFIGVSISTTMILLLIFFISRAIFGSPKHYNKRYKCFIWSLLIFLSLILIVKIRLDISILLSIFMGYILSGKADVNDMFLFKEDISKQEINDIISCEHQDLAKLALSYAVLTDKERYIVELRIKRGMTQQETADYLSQLWNRDVDRLVSIPTIQSWEKETYKKIKTVFENIPWINILINRIEKSVN